MNKVMNKRLYKYCQNNLRSNNLGKVKRSSFSESLFFDYGFGFLDNDFCYFKDSDINLLIDRVKIELHVHLFRESYPERQSRTSIANAHRNEKIGALKVSEDFVLLNSLDNLLLNKEVIAKVSINGLGHFLCASEIHSIEHKQIILVENLIVMANLQRLNIPDSLKNALWLYRGDIQAQQHTSTANQFFKRFTNSNQLICFSDLDPSGLQIALTCGATQWLSLKSIDDLNINLSGIEHEWFKQKNAIAFINSTQYLSREIAQIFSIINKHQKTLKQEHLIEHQLALKLYSLN